MTDLPGSPGWNLVTQPAVDVRSISESVNASLREALKQPAFEIPKPIFPTDFVDQMQQLRRQRLPQNWPANVSARLWAARSIIEAEGIPLAYVSRADVVGLVFEAASRNDRVKVLLTHQNEILDDCDQALAVDLHSHVKGQVPLIRQAVASYRSGHVAASQALSVVVCDTLIRANVASKHTTAKTTAADATGGARTRSPTVGMNKGWLVSVATKGRCKGARPCESN